MKLNIAGKNLNIKFGYKPTLKERVISKVTTLGKMMQSDGEVDLEAMEDLLLYLPEFLLVGMQVHHKDYRYDYDTGKGKEEQLAKTFSIVEKYLEGEDADIMWIFEQLQGALTEDSFLSSLFRREQQGTGQTGAEDSEKN